MFRYRNILFDFFCVLQFLGNGHVPENFSISFDQLKYMSLWADLDDVRVQRVTLCLLRSAPNLQELDLKVMHAEVLLFKHCLVRSEVRGSIRT